MDSLLTMVVHGIARCMAPSALKKALWFRVVELALREQCCERDVEQKGGRASAADQGVHRDVAFQRGAGCGYLCSPAWRISWKACRVDECNSGPPSKLHMSLTLRKRPSG